MGHTPTSASNLPTGCQVDEPSPRSLQDFKLPATQVWRQHFHCKVGCSVQQTNRQHLDHPETPSSSFGQRLVQCRHVNVPMSSDDFFPWVFFRVLSMFWSSEVCRPSCIEDGLRFGLVLLELQNGTMMQQLVVHALDQNHAPHLWWLDFQFAFS